MNTSKYIQTKKSRGLTKVLWTLKKTLSSSDTRLCDSMSLHLMCSLPLCLMNGPGLLDINREKGSHQRTSSPAMSNNPPHRVLKITFRVSQAINKKWIFNQRQGFSQQKSEVVICWSLNGVYPNPNLISNPKLPQVALHWNLTQSHDNKCYFTISPPLMNIMIM